MVKSAIGALLGGVAGAAIWAAVGFYTQYEVGFVAWGVGILAGLGAAVFSDKKGGGGLPVGVMAAVIAAAAVAGGKYATLWLSFNKHAGQMSTATTPEEAKVALAHEVVRQYQADGKAVNWPAGVDPEEASVPQNFPADLWKDVETRWEAMGGPAQQAVMDQITQYKREVVGSVSQSAVMDAFMNSFNAFDLLWFGLAIVTAYQLGAGRETMGGSAET